MKRILFLFFLLVMLFPVNVFADGLSCREANNGYVAIPEDERPDNEFKITGGLKCFDKAESTFDSSRTVSGSFIENSLIEISVSSKSASGRLAETESYSVLIGASGLFCQEINLNIGENIVLVRATPNDGETLEKTAVIKRKKKALKIKLQSAIIISDKVFNISGDCFLIN